MLSGPEALARLREGNRRFVAGVDDPNAALRQTHRLALTQEPFAIVLGDRKSTRLNSSHSSISYAVFCLKKKILLDQVFNLPIPIAMVVMSISQFIILRLS